MERKQERKQNVSPGSAHASRVPVQIYMDAEHWARFDAVARAENRSRSAQVRELISRSLEQFDSEAVA